MKKISKIILVFFIILNMYATTFNVNAGDIWQIGGDFLNLGSDKKDLAGNFNPEKVYPTFEIIIDFLWGIGLLVISVCTVVLGIKYMLVLPGEKSRLKQATTPYIIGVVCVFGALTIWKLVIDILEGSMIG